MVSVSIKVEVTSGEVLGFEVRNPNEDACIQKYIELLTAALEREYDAADVTVELSANSKIHVSAGDIEVEEQLRDEIYTIRHRIWTSAEWVVEED